MNETSPGPSGRRFPKLRIAFSAVCGIVCLLLIVLWVRSYHLLDYWNYGERTVSIHSWSGWLSVDIAEVPNELLLDIHSVYVAEFGFARQPYYVFLAAQHWFLVMLTAVLAAVPWLSKFKWRFSFRTLLIGMTLVAMLLGAVTWAVK